MRRPGGLAALALTLAVFLLAACGGNGDDGQPAATEPSAESGLPPVAVAAEQTAAIESFRSSLVLEYETAQGPVRVEGEGAFQAEPRRGRLTVQVAEGPSAGPGSERDMIFDGPLFYFRAGPDSTGAKWISFDIRRVGGGEESGLGAFGGLDRADPASALLYLGGAGDDVEEVGTEEVRGVETTRYRLTVDLERAAERAGDSRTTIDSAIEATGVSEVPADVWVDRDGRVRKMTMRFENMVAPDGTQTTMTVTNELYDFGADVNVEPPAESEVMGYEQQEGGSR